ncbi:hypothetical protein TrCOL_g9160 [Triparma columacea]|nr:hypothetical protein TrCOL_g9160 [Triparma columacea]
MIQTVRKVREVVDLHEEYATGGIQSLEKKKLEEEGEAEAQRDLQEIRRKVERKKRRRSTTLEKRSLMMKKSNASGMRTQERKAQQSHLLKNFFHEVEIASARVETVLNKLDAPSIAIENELTREIDAWKSELELDDHPDIIPVRFSEPGQKKKVNHLEVELDRLQSDIEAEARTEQVKSVYYWTLKKKERFENEDKLLHKLDRENAMTSNLLDESELYVEELADQNLRLYAEMERDFKSKLQSRKEEWLGALREKVAAVEEVRREEQAERERRYMEIKVECDKYKEMVATLDTEIMQSGMNTNMESPSYIALTKKHEQKEGHLVEIIDRQQARINRQGSKNADLEDEEEELQNYLDELEACVHMSTGNPEIIEKTIHEILLSRKRNVALRQRTSGVEETGLRGVKRSRMSNFAAANAVAMGLRRRTTARRSTMLNMDTTNNELKMENKRLAMQLAEMVSKAGIKEKEQETLREKISALKKLCDDTFEVDERTNTLQKEIDDMDSLLYRFNAAKAVGGKVELGALSEGKDHSFIPLNNREETVHTKLKELKESYEEDVKMLWEEVEKGTKDSGLVGLWSKSRDINVRPLEELASLRNQIERTPRRVFYPKGDYVTSLLKKHIVPTSKDINALKILCILNMVNAAKDAGYKIDTGLVNELEGCISEGKRPPKHITDEAFSAASSTLMVLGAPKTFRLGEVSHAKKQLENACLAFRAADMLHRLRCCLETLKMARAGGLRIDDAKWCGVQLISAAITGAKPTMKVFRILHAACMVASVKYAKLVGVDIGEGLEKDCKKLLCSYEAGAGIDLIAKMSWVLSLLVITELAPIRGEKVFGTNMAKEMLQSCVAESKKGLKVSDTNLIQAVLDDLYAGWEEDEGGGGGLEVILGALNAAERYVNTECIEKAILNAERALKEAEGGGGGIDGEDEEDEVQETVEGGGGEGGEDEDKDEEEDEEEDSPYCDVEEKEERKRLAFRLKRWRAAGFQFLHIRGEQVSKFHNLNDTSNLLKRKKRKAEDAMKNRKNAAMQKLGAMTALAAAAPTPTPMQPGVSDSDQRLPTRRNNFTLRLGQVKKQNAAEEQDVEEIPEDEQILWDSTTSLEAKKRLKRWAEDALETDSLMSEKLKKIWPNVEVMVSRMEEDYVDRELRKINLEFSIINELHKELKNFFGTGLEGGGVGEKDVEYWEGRVELPPRMKKLDGNLNRNEVSLNLLKVQKEGQILTRKLLPAHKKRKSTLGFVNSMMFTKRIGMAWKNAAQAKTGGEGNMENLRKLVTELAQKKQKLEIEVTRLRERERNVLLTRKQIEIRKLEEMNEVVKMKLAEEGVKKEEEEGGKTMFEKLKDEHNMIRKLRDEVRILKDEQHEMEDKLKLVRRGKVSAGEALMTEAEKEEMQQSIYKLKRTVRMYQRAIRKCREQWEEMKKEGKIPETSGAKKLRAAIMQKKALAAMGLGKTLSALPGQEGARGGVGGAVGVGRGGGATPKLKLLQFAFGFGGGRGEGGEGGEEGLGIGTGGGGRAAGEAGQNKVAIANKFKSALLATKGKGRVKGIVGESQKTREKRSLIQVMNIMKERRKKEKQIGVGILSSLKKWSKTV